VVRTKPEDIQADIRPLERFGAKKKISVKQDRDSLFFATRDDDGNTIVRQHKLQDATTEPIEGELTFGRDFYDAIMAVGNFNEAITTDEPDVLNLAAERKGNLVRLFMRTKAENISITAEVKEGPGYFEVPQMALKETEVYRGSDQVTPLIKSIMSVDSSPSVRPTASAYLSKDKIVVFNTNEVAVYKNPFPNSELGNFSIPNFPKSMLDIFMGLEDYSISYSGNFTIISFDKTVIYILNMAANIDEVLLRKIESKLALANGTDQIVVKKSVLARALKAVMMAQPDSSLGAERTSFLIKTTHMGLFWANERSRVAENMELVKDCKKTIAFSIPTKTIVRAIKAVSDSENVVFLYNKPEKVIAVEAGDYLNVIGLHTRVMCPATPRMKEIFNSTTVGGEVIYI
jgi:hypothetical protein